MGVGGKLLAAAATKPTKQILLLCTFILLRIYLFLLLLLLLLQESTEILLEITKFLNCFVLVELSRQNVVSDNALHGISLCDVR
jgi:hypothetical protein